MNATLTVIEASAWLGISKNTAYEAVRRDGKLAGVSVIRVGRRLLVPRAPLLAVLGLDPHTVDETANEEGSG